MKYILLSTVLIAATLISCRSVKNTSNDSTSVSYELVQNGSLMGGGDEGIEESLAVCNTQDELDAIKKKMNAVNYSTKELDQLEVDFKKQTVIGYFQPVRPSGGYSIEVKEFTKVRSDHTESYLLQIALKSSQGPVITVLTQPFLFIVTEKIEGEVDVQVNEP